MEATDKQVFDMRYYLLVMVSQHKGNWDLVIEDLKNKREITSEEVQKYKSEAGSFMSLIDQDYPERLKQSYKPPLVVFYDGDFNVIKEAKHLITIVNEFRATLYATETIQNICSGLIDKCTFVIPFGAKNNNDLIRYLLGKGASIVAVLDRGIGVDNAEDKELYEMLKKNQVIVSSLPNSVGKRSPETSFECSKLCVGLSKSVLVGAVSRKSYLNAVIALGLQQNNDFYCIPFPVGSNYITNQLIHDGATLVESSEMLAFDAELD